MHRSEIARADHNPITNTQLTARCSMSRTQIPRSSQMLELVDSDSEDGLGGNAFSTTKPAVSAKNKSKQRIGHVMAPATKGTRGRAAANKVTKPAQKEKAAARRNGGRIAAAIEQAAEEEDESRTVLVEKSSNEQPKASARGRKKNDPGKREEDAVMEDAPEVPEVKSKPARGRPKKPAPEDEVEEVVKPTRGATAGRKPSAKKTDPVVKEDTDTTEIPETQLPQIQHLTSGDEDDDLAEDSPTRQGSDPLEKPRQIPSSPSKRPGYSSSSSEGGDPALRRRLGDITQKYENLEAKYRDFKEVAVREAERNFDRLKKQMEEKAKGNLPPLPEHGQCTDKAFDSCRTTYFYSQVRGCRAKRRGQGSRHSQEAARR